MTEAPVATYRLQLNTSGGFAGAAELAGYIAGLGVSHLYTSPCLQAAPGSKHGYDVVDWHRLDAELGGEEGWRVLRAALEEQGLRQLLDVVPNHLDIGSARSNPRWCDVLEEGRGSPWSRWFDLDWDLVDREMGGRIELPVLAAPLEHVLAEGGLRCAREGADVFLHHNGHEMPVRSTSLVDLLERAAARGGHGGLAEVSVELAELELSDTVPRRRLHWKQDLKQRLAGMLQRSPAAAKAFDAVLAEATQDAESIRALLEHQVYRPVYWRRCLERVAWRRFFDVNTLAGVRIEDPEVFADCHELVLRLVREGHVEGLRIDHPDGLRDPGEYLERLHEAVPSAWLVVEKILGPEEELPPSWPVAGTTGYEFMNTACGLFVDPRGEEPLTRTYGELTGADTDWDRVSRESRREVLRAVLVPEVGRVMRELQRQHLREDQGVDAAALQGALEETLVRFPVYRTYLAPERGAEAPADRGRVEAALGAARKARPDLPAGAFGRLEKVLSPPPGGAGEAVARLQQLAAALMAKGVEDTALYRYHRLVALNEVGGDPGRFGVSPEAFHAWAASARERCPRGLLSTSTHDTKRGEDVRARLHLLSEIPALWEAAVRRWSARATPHKRDGLPDRNTEYLLYQTLVGAWPVGRERLQAYMLKAVREAKERTSWLDPDPGYEEALSAFIDGVLRDSGLMHDVRRFVDTLLAPGRINGLAQTLVKLAAPGVPDIYQGTELWDLSLVDPDNRRTVDFRLRRRLKQSLRRQDGAAALQGMDQGLPKLHLIHCALGLRRRRPGAFSREGSYEPLHAGGPKAANAVAWLRGDQVLALVPRLVIGTGGDWEDTVLEIPRGRWRNVLTGESHEGGKLGVGGLLARFPVALLEREDAP